MRYRIFKKGKQRIFKGKTYGFDIETEGQKNNFVCASIVSDKEKWFFTDRQSLLDFLKTSRFKNSLVVATNLSFDYFGLFGKDSKEGMQFNTQFQHSNLLYSKSYIHKGEFCKKRPDQGKCNITFIDTFNYFKSSVEEMGDILGLPKLEKPSCFSRMPQNNDEWKEMKEYNMRDAEVSLKFFNFLMIGFYQYGASFRPTIAGISMSIFRNVYLDKDYFGLSIPDLKDHFEGYYGGRTEAFERGYFNNMNYYDVNSLYPSCMKDHEFPDPNTHRVTHKNTLEYIQNYEGISLVKVFCPSLQFPLLPFRTDKLIFPIGEFTSWQSHVELREALKLGYKIKKVYKTHYYKSTCRPFDDYVTKFYDLKNKLKGDPRRIIAKLLLNSLYGKFAQKFEGRDNWVPCDMTKEELHKLKDFEIIDGYIRIKYDTEPSAFCIPIWSIYITAYSRLKMRNYFIKCDPVYCDTDSLITKNVLPDSDKIGELELEKSLKEVYIVKPKMYAGVTTKGKQFVKTKGIGKALDYKDFINLIHSKNPSVTYDRFIRPKEAIRRGLQINEILPITKNLSLEDTKRLWNEAYDPIIQQKSNPRKIS